MRPFSTLKKLLYDSLPGRIFRSSGIRRWFLGVLVFLVVTAILAMDFYQVQKLEIGMPSPADFRATRTVDYIDEGKTEELREMAARMVEPVYDPDLVVNNEVQAQLSQSFLTAEKIRSRDDLEEPEKEEHLAEELPYYLPTSALDAFLAIDEQRLAILESKAEELIQAALQGGIREHQLEEERESLKIEVENLSLTAEETELLSAITTEIIRPNLVFNEEETERQRSKARMNVQPARRTIVQDLPIVRKGEIITPEHMEQLEALGLQRKVENNRARVVGLAILILVMLVVGLVYLYLFKKDIWHNEGLLALLGLVLIVNLLVAKLLTLIPNTLYGYLIPVAAGSMLVAILLDNHLSVLFTIVMASFVGLIVGGDLNYAVVAMVGGLVGTFSVSRLHQRSHLTRAGLLVAAGNMTAIIGTGLYTAQPWQEVSLGTFLGIINGVLAAVLTIGLLPYLENTFGLTTAVTLLEISNPNHPLLKRLLLEAPGTYHHSILVGNLGEAAAEAVGADSLLVRAGAYYHDAGKLKRPYFFIENQLSKDNPHDKIAANLSALIITSHVKDGLELAQRHRLPQVIKDIIGQHHGTTLLTYFYNQALEEAKEQKVVKEDFRYVGPKPQTKEAAIVMLADSVEAAVRSLGKPTPNRIEGMVHRLIKERLHDGQLDECDLTFRDLSAIAAAFVQVLAGIYHSRIEYPQKVGQVAEKEEKSAGTNSRQAKKIAVSPGTDEIAKTGG
ncbi:MAG: HDIG domain-containing protein [Firmicutes bacterium]|nr:HDIG domain-containing protein [Bacillota bacterium]